MCLKFIDQLPWPVTAVNKRQPFLLLLPVVLGSEGQGKGKRVISAINYSLSSAYISAPRLDRHLSGASFKVLHSFPCMLGTE